MDMMYITEICLKARIRVYDTVELWELHGDVFLINLPHHVSSRVVRQYEHDNKFYVETQNTVYECEQEPLLRAISSYDEVEKAKLQVV